MKDIQQVQRLNAQIEPNNVEAEQLIIAGIFEGGSLLSLVVDAITPEMFFSSLLGAFYRAALFLRDSDRDINTLNLAASLRETGFKDLYGFESIAALVNSTYADVMGSTYVQSPAHYESAAALIRGASIRRDLIKASRAAIAAAYDEEVTILDACTKAQDMIGEAMSASQPRSTVFEVGAAYTDRIAEFLDPEAEDSSPIIPSGYAAWDEMLEGGFRGGEFTVIGGDSGIGKSMLLFGAAWNMAKFLSAQGKVGYIGSMEMSTRNVVDRWIASEAKVALSRMRRRDFRDEDLERIAKASAVGDLLNNLAIDEDNKATIPQILNRAKEFARKHARKHGGAGELGFIVIDNIKIAEKGGDDFSLINRYVKEMKGIAKDYNIPVISLSQLTKESLKGTDKRPTIDGLYGGKAIEENADDVFGLYRGEKYDDFELPSDRAEIISLKRRNADGCGKNRKVILGYNGSLATFFDIGAPKPAQKSESKQAITTSPSDNTNYFGDLEDGCQVVLNISYSTPEEKQEMNDRINAGEIPKPNEVCGVTHLSIAETPEVGKFGIAHLLLPDNSAIKVAVDELRRVS
jgi:replicative DNA helicase